MSVKAATILAISVKNVLIVRGKNKPFALFHPQNLRTSPFLGKLMVLKGECKMKHDILFDFFPRRHDSTDIL